MKFDPAKLKKIWPDQKIIDEYPYEVIAEKTVEVENAIIVLTELGIDFYRRYRMLRFKTLHDANISKLMV